MDNKQDAVKQVEAGDNNTNMQTTTNLNSEITARPNAFTSHFVLLEAGQGQFSVRVLKMVGSTMLFLSAKGVDLFNELAVAMPARTSSKDIISSTIIGEHGQSNSAVLAAKLSKRYARQFFVSMNINLDRIVGPLLEKALVSYMHDNLEQFV